MSEVQTVRGDTLLVVVLIFSICGCVQMVVLHKMFNQYYREWVVHFEVMEVILLALQPPEIREHSKRVSALSEKLAMQLRLPVERMSIIRVAGLLHEIKEIDHIPGHLTIEAEILDVADYFDEATFGCDVPMVLDDAIEEIRREAGTRYNPEVVKAFMKLVLRSEGKRIMRTDSSVP